MTQKIKLIFASFLVFSVAMPVYAAEFMSPGKDDNNSVVIGSKETHKNLYIAGANLTLNGETKGDLFAAGSQITIDGETEQDAVVAGGTVGIGGKVGGDLRAAGGNLSLTAPVQGDALLAGGNINISEKSEIGGDLVIAGGNVNVNSAVKGNVKIAGGSVLLNSKVEGTVYVEAGQKVIFGELADIPGKIVVVSPVSPTTKDGARISTPEVNKISKRAVKSGAAGLISFFVVVKLLGYFVFAFLLWLIFKQRTENFINQTTAKFWRNTGLGFVVLICVPVSAFILGFTLIGFYIALFSMLIYIILLLTSFALTPILIGNWITMKLSKKQSMNFTWYGIAIGVIVLTIIAFVPIIGSLAILILALASFGTLTRALWMSARGSRAQILN